MSSIKTIREKFARHELVIGTHIGFDSICLTEIMGNIGFDYVWIDSEHSALDKKDIQHHLVAARAGGTAGFVRIPWNDPVLAKPILDMGADAIIFPMIISLEDAKLAISACQYPPKGIRGFGLRRANNYGMGNMPEYIKNGEDNLLKILQIEHVDIIKDLRKILELKDFDAVVIGPKDFACSLGTPGADLDPETGKYFDEICAIVKESDKALGVSGSFTEEFVETWLDRGVNYITMGFDYQYVIKGARQTIDGARRICEEYKKK